MKRIKLEENNQKSFSEESVDKAILAFGSCECHGEHLPYGTDTFVSYDLALEVAGRLEDTVVVPPMWYGMSMHYEFFIKNGIVKELGRAISTAFKNVSRKDYSNK